MLAIVTSLACSCLTAQAQERKGKTRPRVATPVRANPTPLSPRDIARIAFPSTVSVYSVTDDGDVYSGADFVVSPGVVATCHHVIEGTAGIAVSPLSGDRKLTRARLLRSDEVRDIALLAVPSLKLPPLRLSMAEDMYVGEAAYAIGNPKGLEGTFSTGVLSNFHKLDTETYLLQFTASASPGNSGGRC